MKLIRALLATLALVLAGLTITPTQVLAWQALPAGYTNCWGGPLVTGAGDRTCYDVSAGTIYIIDGSGNVYASMSATGGSGGMGWGHIMSPGEWNYVNSTTTATATITTTATLSATNARIRVGSAASHDLLEWFSGATTHEFVMVP